MPSALARGIGLRIVGQGLAASIVCMYVCPSRFWNAIIFGKDRSSSGKDRSGFRNACHVTLKNVDGDLEDVLSC